MAHEHVSAPAPGADRRAQKRSLAIVLVLTTAFTAAEFVGGLLTGSLALLADAGHMLSDDVSLALALFALWLADRPATGTKTFGYKRAEILVALVNGVTLVAISIWIFIEASQRFAEPPEILGGWMLAVAAVGVTVNLVGVAVLWRSQGASLNLLAAFRHVVADLLGSLAVIAAAIVILVTGWVYVDPLISVLIGVLILLSSWTVLRDSVRILLEATPAGIDANVIGQRIADSPGVAEVHDLHIWTITSGFPALSAHVLVGRDDDCHARRRELEALLKRECGISHTTLQVDHVGDEHPVLQPVRFLSRSVGGSTEGDLCPPEP